MSLSGEGDDREAGLRVQAAVYLLVLFVRLGWMNQVLAGGN
jgi:hypothetical protein